MTNRRNYYRILQVQPDAPFEVIRASFRTMMRELQLHPDLGGEHWNAKILTEAYATLSNPRKRALYDQRLYERYTKNPYSKNAADKQPLITHFCPFCKRPMARAALSGESCPSCQSPLKSQPAEAADSDRRRAVARIRKSGKLTYFTSWPQKGQPGELVDLSPQGLRFTCTEDLKLGLHVKISSPLLKASAIVANSTKQNVSHQQVYAIGARFLAVSYTEAKGSFYSTSV